MQGNRKNKTTPVIYVRSRIPEEYQKKIKVLSAKMIIEPWKYGEPEPEPKADISECNIVLTSGSVILYLS